jgi:hypothetical protein
MGRSKNAIVEAESPTEITEQQKSFVEALLLGDSISQAAQRVGAGRVAATRWMAMGHIVRFAYDRFRRA